MATYQRYHEVKTMQEPEMLPGDNGSRSGTPVSIIEDRLFASHSSPLSSQHEVVTTYTHVSSPSVPPHSISPEYITSSPTSFANGAPQHLSSQYSLSTSAKYILSPPEAHRYFSETYRIGADPTDQIRYPVDLGRASIDASEDSNRVMIDQGRCSIDSSRVSGDSNRIAIDPYRHLTNELSRNSTDSQRTPPIDADQYRGSEDLYLSNPIDLQRVPDSNGLSSLGSAQRQRIISGLQKFQDNRYIEPVGKRDINEILGIGPGVSINYRTVEESTRPLSESPHRPLEESAGILRNHADPQRLIQESFREYFNDMPRHSGESIRIINNDARGTGENLCYTQTENVRYVESTDIPRSLLQGERVLIDDHQLSGEIRMTAVSTHADLLPENLRVTEAPLEPDLPHNLISETLKTSEGLMIMMPTNLSRVNSATTHSSMDENLPLDLNDSHNILPENLRMIATDNAHNFVQENFRLGSETPQNLITDSVQRLTIETSHMVPENLCLSGPSQQLIPENLHISPNVNAVANHNDNIVNDRIMVHPHPAESPMPSNLRTHYGHSTHRAMIESPRPGNEIIRSHSPLYQDVYHSDIHGNILSVAPPTPSPSVAHINESSLPQYYTTAYLSHTQQQQSHPLHSMPSQFTAYINEDFDDRDLRDNLSLEEKIERGYQDIKPFDQNYPVSMPPMHLSQPGIAQVSSIIRPPKVKKPKEQKPPRLPIIHKCIECERLFKNSTQLKNHMWRHTGEKPFTCDDCGSKFTQQGNLRAHKRIHTGERPYECTNCKSCFTQLSTLKTHQKIHSDERPYACNQCDAAFRQVANLKTHMVTHTGERPHQCDLCDKAFTQKSNLKAHKNRVHCKDDMGNPVKRGRKKNPMASKPFLCVECGAKFTMLNNLKIHMRLHRGDRTYECNECGAGFAQRSNLKTHTMRMHEIELPIMPPRKIKCDECPAMFRQKRCLKTHKKRRHPIKSLKIKILRESKYLMNTSDGSNNPLSEEEDFRVYNGMPNETMYGRVESIEGGTNSFKQEIESSDDYDEESEDPNSSKDGERNLCVPNPIVQFYEPKSETFVPKAEPYDDQSEIVSSSHLDILHPSDIQREFSQGSYQNVPSKEMEEELPNISGLTGDSSAGDSNISETHRDS